MKNLRTHDIRRGSQWRTKSRLSQTDEQAQRAFETLGPDTQMNVSLARCPLRGIK